jgi:hypothetical protein
VYFIKDTTCRIKFPQQVDSRNIMKANFITGIDRDTFGGALLYHLQGKEDTPISVQLLVVWRWGLSVFYSDSWIIKHKNILDWDKDRLKELYDIYDSQRELYFLAKDWKLDDNTKLKTKCVPSFDFKIKVTIYEKSSLKPLQVDPNR